MNAGYAVGIGGIVAFLPISRIHGEIRVGHLHDFKARFCLFLVSSVPRAATLCDFSSPMLDPSLTPRFFCRRPQIISAGAVNDTRNLVVTCVEKGDLDAILRSRARLANSTAASEALLQK